MSSYRALTAVSEVVSQLRRKTLELPTVLILSAVFSRSSLPRPTRMIPAAPAVLHASAVSYSTVLVDYSERGKAEEEEEDKVKCYGATLTTPSVPPAPVMSTTFPDTFSPGLDGSREA